MLTVKYISEFGFETVFLAVEVRTRGREYPAVQDNIAGRNLLADDRPNFVVDCKRGPSESETIRDGQIYVMNENGKTVANYDLRQASGVQANDTKQYQEIIHTKTFRAGAMLGNQQTSTGTPL